VVAMETSPCLCLQLTFCTPGESAADVFNRLVASEVHSLIAFIDVY